MGDVPTTINEPATIVNKILKFAIDEGMRAAKAALLVGAPWLGWPVISQVTDFILSKVGSYFYIYFAEHTTLSIISFQTKAERDAFEASLQRLRAAQAGGTDAEKEEARRQSDEALRRLVGFDGWAHP